VIILDYIKTLSLNAATRFLLEEGYIEEEYVEQAHDDYDRIFIYPYALYNGRRCSVGISAFTPPRENIGNSPQRQEYLPPELKLYRGVYENKKQPDDNMQK
jgi:hypothetical protein